MPGKAHLRSTRVHLEFNMNLDCLLWYSTYSPKCSSFSLIEFRPPGGSCYMKTGNATIPFSLFLSLMAKYKESPNLLVEFTLWMPQSVKRTDFPWRRRRDELSYFIMDCNRKVLLGQLCFLTKKDSVEKRVSSVLGSYLRMSRVRKGALVILLKTVWSGLFSQFMGAHPESRWKLGVTLQPCCVHITRPFISGTQMHNGRQM